MPRRGARPRRRLRLWHVFALRELPLFERLIIDSEVYDAWARAIAAGDGMSRVLGGPFYMDPLYPYVLGGLYKLFGRDLLLVRLVQVAFGVATCGLVAVLGRRLSGPVAGNLGAFLLAIYPAAIFQDGEFEKTALSVFLATSSLVLFLMPTVWARLGAGAALGLTLLTRGNMMLLAPFAVALLLARRDWKSAGAFVLGAALMVAPATLRNLHVSGEWVLTTSSAGQVFYTGNNPANADGAYHSVPFGRPQTGHEEGDFLREAERRTGRRMSANEVSLFWAREALAHIARAPGFAAAVTLRKLGLFWSDVEIPDAWDLRFISQYSLPLRLPLASFSLIAALGLLGAFPAARKGDGRILIGYVLLYCASVILFFLFSRYRLHVVPPLAAMAGTGLVWAMERLRAGAHRELALPASLAVALALFSAFSFPSRRTEAISNYASLAEMHQERGDFASARATLHEARRRAPGEATVLCALSKLSLRTGENAAAVEFANRCLQANPVFPDAWYLLGLSFEASGDHDRARDAYRQQLRIIPGHEHAIGRLK